METVVRLAREVRMSPIDFARYVTAPKQEGTGAALGWNDPEFQRKQRFGELLKTQSVDALAGLAEMVTKVDKLRHGTQPNVLYCRVFLCLAFVTV